LTTAFIHTALLARYLEYFHKRWGDAKTYQIEKQGMKNLFHCFFSIDHKK